MTLENIRQWEGKDVVDADGAKIGKLEDVYFDAETDEPQFVTVHTGLLGHNLTFVPLTNATLGQNYLQVSRAKDEVKNAPTIEKDGEISAEDEALLFRYYGMDYVPAPPPRGRRLVRH
jgi:sporulation protein YlmC with PRC-barrel domain